MFKCCPICYRVEEEVPFKILNDPKAEELQQRFFRLLERYISVNSFGEENHAGEEDEERINDSFSAVTLQKLSEVGMTSCLECLQIMESFCELYHQLKTIELRLNWKVMTLKKIMEAGEKSPTRLKYFRECLASRDEVDEGGPSSHWGGSLIDSIIESRKLLIEKCSAKVGIQNCLPKLLIKRWHSEAQHRKSDNNPCSQQGGFRNTEATANISCEMDKNNGELMRDIKMELANENEVDSTATPHQIDQKTTKLEPDLDDDTGSAPEDGERERSSSPEARHHRQSRYYRYRCPTCDKVFSNSQRLQMHIDEAHIEAKDNDSNNDSSCWTSSSSSDEEEHASDSESSEDCSEVKLKLRNMLNLKCHLRKRNNLIRHDGKRQLEDERGQSTRIPLSESSDESDNLKEVEQKLGKAVKSMKRAIENDENPASRSSKPRKGKSKIKAPELTKHSITLLWPCKMDNCSEKFPSEETLQEHTKLHGNFTCTFCNATHSFAPDMAWHEIATHSKKKFKQQPMLRCPRPRCPYSGSGKEAYIRHHLGEHLSLTYRRTDICSVCDAVFPMRSQSENKRSHYYHHQTHHNLDNLAENQTVQKCDEGTCTAYFLTEFQLRRHKAHAHQTDRGKYYCPACHVSYSTWTALSTHKRKAKCHKEALGVPCTFANCDYRFESKAGLDIHIRQLHTNPRNQVNCPECAKPCLSKAGLKVHMGVHKKEIRKWICEICGKEFKSHEQLQLHHLSHSGPKSWKFMCSVCSKKCLTNGKLQEHMRTHTKEKAFICQICGEKYAHRHNLRNHVNSKHGDQVQDIPKKIHKPNMTSRKGIKRKWEGGKGHDKNSTGDDTDTE